ncbi:unnamed protein product [Heterobilharzia americana]|nr:unnamed protein product [Heterobilharzia americana]
MSGIFEAIDNHIVVFLSFPALICFYLLARSIWRYIRLSILPRPSVQSLNRVLDDDTSEYDCPICMDFPSFRIETSCGHRFCALVVTVSRIFVMSPLGAVRNWDNTFAECFTVHWKRTIYSRVISCPICRGRVSTLTKLFTEEELQNPSRKRSQIEADLKLFNRWHSGGHISIIDRLRDLPTFTYGFIQLLLSGQGTFALMQIRLIMLGLCVLFYLITPFDFIPDIVTGCLGLLDDVVVLCIFMIHVISVYQAISRGEFNNR